MRLNCLSVGLGAALLWLVCGSDAKVLLALDNRALLATVCIATGIGSAWAASILWSIASRRLIVSETLFALFYSFLWDRAWPGALQLLAAVLFTLGILASIRAHQ